MIPIPDDANHSDIEQWCNRGVVMVREGTSDYVPHWYLGCDARRRVSVQPLEGEQRNLTSAEFVSVHWPRCGSVNIPGKHYAVHAARRTQRQYRRTWHVGGLNIITPRSWDVARFMSAVPTAMTTSARLLAQACFRAEYPDYRHADALLSREERVSVAISPRVIVAGDATGKRMFYYNGMLAATASGGVLHPVGDEVPVRKIAKLLEGHYHVASYK